VRVTINEYLEIAKFYSTEKSSVFINGLLDKIFKYLKDNQKIVKSGRGLIGEV
jgi:N utilization substance protein B